MQEDGPEERVNTQRYGAPSAQGLELSTWFASISA